MDSSSLTPQIETGIQHMSESVFVGLCRTVGTPQQVAMRRDVADIVEMVRNKGSKSNQNMKLLSGSHREGFRMKGSDIDTMFWFKDRVIWDLSQTQFYNVHRQALILSVSSESPPGFTLLQLLTPRADGRVISALVTMNGRRYISSSKYRDITCSEVVPNSTVHGPCGRGAVGSLECDSAHCFACDYWPPSASSWIDGCHTWPQSQVVRDIVRSGCHFVAIGHKLGNHESNEWRISFSLAEQKLVYSMNHCQFLTYGLLKLFLKEVINNGLDDDDEKLLCSYHMKTAVFWMIQQNTIPNWCPQNLLKCFWYCFKLILKWVHEGVCPNFFIPENNMFLSNIHGEAQKRLFVRLFGFYEKGLASLLHSPSIGSYIMNVLYNPTLSVCTDEHTLISEIKFDKEMFKELYKENTLSSPDFYLIIKYLNTVEQLTFSPLTQSQVVMLQVLTASLLHKATFTLQNMYSNVSENKLMYIADRMSCYMLKLTAEFGCISNRLYIAMYYYKTLGYTEALSVIEMTKVNLAQPYVMYDETVDTERYIEAVGGQSLSTKLRHAVAWNIKLDNIIIYINELMTEQMVSLQNRFPHLTIPPLVVLHMLEFLCYRHIDTMRAQTALNDLQVLVHHDQGVYVALHLRDISWQILGICQQISGNLQAALYSYQQSLTQYPYHKIQSATRMRIHELG